MKITRHQYPESKALGKDYEDIRNFLIKIKDTEYSFARWDWMITHSMTQAIDLSKIAMWKDKDDIVALVIFDIEPDLVWIRVLDKYNYLLDEMIDYAKENYGHDYRVKIMVQDDDELLQKHLASDGFIAINHKEYTSVLFPDENDMTYDLPKGYKMVSLKEAPSVSEYYRLFWRGFNHELNGEGKYIHSDEKEAEGKKEIFRKNNNLNHKMIVQDKTNAHVAFCGLWYDDKLDFAIVEPLATDPDHRRLGLAKAAMFEGIKRVRMDGAKRIIVNTSKQFYYNRGFRPYRTQTVWEKKLQKKES